MLPALLLLAFSDPDLGFHVLRENAPTDAVRVENIELKRDKGTLTLKTGQLAFVKGPADRPMIAVFTGEGVFQLTAVLPMEAAHIAKVIGKPEIEEAFDSAVIFFTDDTYDEVKKQASAMPLDPHAAQVLKNVRDKNHIEEEVLADLYSPKRGASFRAFMHGKKYNDLRFFSVPRGAVPEIEAPEEVGLIEAGENGGIWYLSHYETEWAANTASSSEDKRDVQAIHYKIDTEVAKGGALSATTELEVSTVFPGARILRFGLAPSLKLKRVTNEKGRELTFIQGSHVHVILPQPLEAQKKYTLRFEYEGSKVIFDEGGGNFSVLARSSWYPNVNTFLDHATYELKFRVPKRYTLVSVGKLVNESKDGDTAVTEWKSDVPIAVAGFNYGDFKKKKVSDELANYEMEVYTTSEVPAALEPFTRQMSLSPSAMAQNAMADAQNSMRLFQKLFGDAPYGRLAITQQPAFSFGQSWPTLVYLPVSAFLDSTQRWSLMGARSFKFSEFILEVTPHEIAHQWWGHMVGWASYHDQWLSEGFAEFSAGLFLEATNPGEVPKFWDRLHNEITEKNNFGNSANDAGPIWLGLRLNTPKNADAYRRMVYPKGAYILQMIRMLMRDDKTGDQDFIAMMKDYVKTHLYRNATSESFLAVVAKHMKPAMDLDGSHNMDWFKREWIYGTDLPKYHLDYSLKPAPVDGKVRMTLKLTESDVSPDFVMRVPIYLDFDGRVVRVGTVAMHGNMTTPEIPIDLPKRPKRVIIGANHDVLAAETVVKETP